jgi:hypothetical protein
LKHVKLENLLHSLCQILSSYPTIIDSRLSRKYKSKRELCHVNTFFDDILAGVDHMGDGVLDYFLTCDFQSEDTAVFGHLKHWVDHGLLEDKYFVRLQLLQVVVLLEHGDAAL